MENDLKILSIMNCGVLINTKRTAILIDGICEETEYFDGLDAQTYRKMMNKEAPFGQIDYILHTHSHKDHLDFNRLAQYVAAHKISGLFLPKADNPGMAALQEQINKNKIQFVTPEFGVNEKREWVMGDVSLTYFRNAHSGKEYENVNHYTLLLETPAKTIYFSGDSDFMAEAQAENLKGIDVDVAFFNPYHLSSASGRMIISKINAKANYIYHIPPEEKDQFQIRRRAVRDIQKYQNLLPQTDLILTNNIYLPF